MAVPFWRRLTEVRHYKQRGLNCTMTNVFDRKGRRPLSHKVVCTDAAGKRVVDDFAILGRARRRRRR
jgi:hypothetical protein